MTILVGCSGWSYDDWVGGFYPIDLANKKGAWFDYYSKYFSTVEINSSFYRPPGEFQVNAWIKKGKDKKGVRILREGSPARDPQGPSGGEQRKGDLLSHLF